MAIKFYKVLVRLSEKQLKTISLGAGVNGKAALRLTNTLRIKIPKKNTDEEADALPQVEELELGIHIADGLLFSRLRTADGIRYFTDIIRQYSNTCPIVVNWVGRGDFSDKKIPVHVNRGHLVHASRTAGRLRAELIRKLRTLGSGFEF